MILELLLFWLVLHVLKVLCSIIVRRSISNVSYVSNNANGVSSLTTSGSHCHECLQLSCFSKTANLCRRTISEVYHSNYFNYFRIQFCQVTFEVPPRYLYKLIGGWGKSNVTTKTYIMHWFTCGSVCMVIGNIMAPFFIAYCLYDVILTDYETVQMRLFGTPRQSDHSGSSNTADFFETGSIITPILPGLNFPGHQVTGFWLCTILVTTIHELGHAVAAMQENLQIKRFGFFFLFAIPGAFVEIEEFVQCVAPSAQLRIYAAGVWHNIMLAIAAFVCMSNLWGALTLTSFQPVTNGLLLIDRPKNIFGSSNLLREGDIIISLNGMPITEPRDLQQFVIHSQSNKLSNLELTFIRQYLYSTPTPTSNDITMPVLFDQYHRSTPRAVDYSDTHQSPNNTSTSIQLNTSAINLPETILSDQIPEKGSLEIVDRKKRSLHQSDEEGHVLKGVSVCSRVPPTYTGSNALSLQHLCCKNLFDNHVFTNETSSLQESPLDCFMNVETEVTHDIRLFCLPGRDVFMQSDNGVNTMYCKTASDCSDKFGQSNNMLCLQSLTRSPEMIITVELASGSDLIVEGNPSILFHHRYFTFGRLDVSNGLKSMLKTFLGEQYGFNVYTYLLWLPDKLHFYLSLIIQLSISVAMINVLPVMNLDGSFCLPLFLKILFPKHTFKIVDRLIGIFTIAIIIIVLLSFIPAVLRDIQESF